MKVIRHDDECVQIEILPNLGGFKPLLPHNFAAVIFLHLVVDDLAENALFPERA